jgi:hypothetical protein
VLSESSIQKIDDLTVAASRSAQRINIC